MVAQHDDIDTFIGSNANGNLNNYSIERVNAGAEEEVTVTELGMDTTNNDHIENDPLAISTNLSADHLVLNHDNAIATIENAAHERDSTERQIIRVIDGICANSRNDSDAQNEECDPSSDIGVHVSNADGVIKAEPIPIYDNHICNDDEIDVVLDEPFEEVCDDVIMIIGKSFPLPLRMTTEEKIKRENDPMSGNLTYSVSVRIYFIIKIR